MSTKTRKAPTENNKAAMTSATGTRFISAYESAVQGYADEYVTIVIDRVTFPGGALNTEEEGKFEVVITNNGPLSMRNPTVRFAGENGVTVKGGGAIAEFKESFLLNIGDIAPGEAHRVGPGAGYDSFQHLNFKAPDAAQGEEVLLEVSIEEFEADLSPLLNGNNGGGSGTWESDVLAS